MAQMRSTGMGGSRQGAAGATRDRTDAPDAMAGVSRRLAVLEQSVAALHSVAAVGRTGRTWLTTREVAQALGRAEYTVRQWCNHRRLTARKIGNGREWRIHRAEVDRYLRDGLLPA